MKNAGLALDCRCHFRPITDNDRESLGFVDCSDQGIAAGPRRPLFLQKSPHIMQAVDGILRYSIGREYQAAVGTEPDLNRTVDIHRGRAGRNSSGGRERSRNTILGNIPKGIRQRCTTQCT